MNPFDMPPSGSPVPMPEPETAAPAPRRGRMALVALLAAGLVAGGIAGVSQLASADQPELATAAPDDSEGSDELLPSDDESTDDVDNDDAGTDDGDVSVDGEIVIDMGGDEPIVLDLGEIEGDVSQLTECIGLPAFEFDLDGDVGDFGGFGEWDPETFDLEELFGDEFFEQLPALDELFGEFDVDGEFGTFEDFGGSITVTGPDGVSVIDLGEGGSVTITKNGDELTIESTGDANVQELDDLFGDFGAVLDGELFGDEFFEEFSTIFEEFGLDDFDLEEFDEGAFDEFVEGLPALDELPELEGLDPAAIESCIDEVLGN